VVGGGGTAFHRNVIQREISRVLVLTCLANQRCIATAEDNYALDNAFTLIEGQPQLWWCKVGQTRPLSLAFNYIRVVINIDLHRW
jgi:hypothetical protein